MLCATIAHSSFQPQIGMSKRTNSEPYVCTPMNNLNAIIAEAKRKRQSFYIGAASESGSTAVDAVRNRDQGGHHADDKVPKSYRLDRVNHTGLLQEKSVSKLEADLIAKHGNHPLCLNEKQGQRRCINADRGCVYVRKYDRRDSSTVGRRRNLGTQRIRRLGREPRNGPSTCSSVSFQA